MTFAHPYALLLPLAAGLLLLRKKRNQALLYPSIETLRTAGPGLRVILRKPVLFILGLVFVASLALAAARPQIIDRLNKPLEGRNLMLTLDLSGSMNAQDFQTTFGRTNRLEAVKAVVAEFVKNRREDRIGLVVFGTNAYLQSPLTMDHALITDMIERLQVGMAGEDTAIGDGLGLSLKRIQDIEGSSKAIILLTDGVNRTGRVNPIKAAGIAKDLGIKIHTVGIGSNSPLPGLRGGLLFRPRQGSEFDEETLKKIAEITGGVYFNASSIEGLREVYKEIDKLERTGSEDPAGEIVYELFPWFIMTALGSYLFYVLLARSVFLKIP